MTPLSDQQRLFLIESDQLYRAWREVAQQVRQYRFGMRWSRSGGREYLIRLTDRKGYGKSLGPRSPATEQIYQAFVEGRDRAKERYRGL